MKEIHTAIEIDAPADRVWRALTDFASYPEWNPFLRRVAGPATAGAWLDVRAEPQGARATSFRALVLAAEPCRELRWRGRLPIPGLFAGEHAFVIEPLGGDRVRLVQRERFRGLLVPLLSRRIDRDIRGGFEAMNRALKARAESL
jgi:hypothetical protein